MYKRLRFLGNKLLSHFLTLVFVALWHGIAPGFFLCFIGEFATIVMEQQVSETKYYKPIKKGPFCSIHTEAAKWCYNQFTRRSSERLENASPDEQCSPKSHEVFFFLILDHSPFTMSQVFVSHVLSKLISLHLILIHCCYAYIQECEISNHF